MARIGERIPLSSFYEVLNVDDVVEVTLEFPTADLEPAKGAVPIAFSEQLLEVETYRAFTDVSTFAAETEPLVECW